MKEIRIMKYEIYGNIYGKKLCYIASELVNKTYPYCLSLSLAILKYALPNKLTLLKNLKKS